MTTVLSALDAAVERYGPGAVTDPLALTGALRAVTNAPAEPEIAALTGVAATDALARMRDALKQDADPVRALSAAVAAADPAADPDAPSAARWAATMLGAALGLLPREWAAAELPGPLGTPNTPDAGRAETEVLTTPQGGGARRRRGRVLAAAAVVAVLAGAGGYLALSRGTDPEPNAVAGAPLSVSPPAQPTSTPPTSAASSASAADPRSAFDNPALLAFAEPYLAAPGVVCEAKTPGINQQESVSCVLGDGYVGLFGKLLSVEVMRDLRGGFLDGDPARPGTVRSLRWKYVPGRPGVRTGIPASRAEDGEGTRVRFLDPEGLPVLYFDQDSSASTGLIASTDPARDLDVLRAYWADPSR